MKHDIRIEGPAYRLRPVMLEDAGPMVALRTDPERAKFLNETSPRVEDQERYIRAYFDKGGDYYFVVERKSDGKWEGTVAVYDIDPVRRQGEWGRWILRDGSMAAIESAWLIYRVAFEVLGLALVYCRTIAENKTVIEFHRHCGVKDIGIIRNHAVIRGHAYDSFEQHMTVDRWEIKGPVLREQAQRVAQLLERGSR